MCVVVLLRWLLRTTKVDHLTSETVGADVQTCGTEFWLRGLTAQLPKTEFEILQTGGDGAGLARGFGF